MFWNGPRSRFIEEEAGPHVRMYRKYNKYVLMYLCAYVCLMTLTSEIFSDEKQR